jgi:ATP-dependent Clp protease ATP-binding subunit ClpC
LTVGEKKILSSNLALSSACKRILVYAQEEAAHLNGRVGGEHLLVGILREEEANASEILREHGLHLDAAREKIVPMSPRKND